MSDVKLKSCPCCGGENVRVVERPDSSRSVQCDYCRMHTEWTTSEDDAVSRWNRRVVDGTRTRLLPCPFCGGVAETLFFPTSYVVAVACSRCGMRTDADENFSEVAALWNRRG